MKKKIAGFALTAVVALGSMSAFAAGGDSAGQGGAQGQGNGQRNMVRTESQKKSEECTGEKKSERLQSIVSGLEAAGETEIAAKLQSGDYGTMREAIESLSEEENLKVRETMRELKLNGNGNASGKGMAKRDGSMGLCDQ